MNPWSEYAILNFQILVKNDTFANFIQWFSMVGSIVGVSLIAKELKASPRGQVFAAGICATIPMGILQGSSTQTDYVVSFWLVCFIYFSMLLRKEAKVLYAFGTGAALGLGVLTKPTMYIFAFPFLVWLVISIIKTRNRKQFQMIVLVSIIAFILNISHYVRNYDLFNNPLSPGQDGPDGVLSNEIYTFSALSSNIIRNVGLHLGTPSIRVNSGIEKSITMLHKLLGISLNDKRTTWGDTKFQVHFSSYEDSTGNPIHLFLFTTSLLIYLFRRPKEWDTSLYIISLVFAFLIFNGYLKWQPWNSRFHLPLFVLSSVIIGLVFSQLRNTNIVNLIIMSIIIVSLPWVLNNKSRPLLGEESILKKSRSELYFQNNPAMFEPYYKAASILQEISCTNIGLVINNDDWEYPLWVLLHKPKMEIKRLDHLNVTNISEKMYDNSNPDESKICALFTINANPSLTVSIKDGRFSKVWSMHSVNVYKKYSLP
jgi:4-amino-4-deoxy-L-arabinose transferase-like glycosyltransferase